MPCRDDYDTKVYTEREYDYIVAQMKELQTKLDTVTRLLCKQIKYIETDETGDQHWLVPEVLNWWDAHKIKDKERLDRAKHTGLSKLTEDEKEALGLQNYD